MSRGKSMLNRFGGVVAGVTIVITPADGLGTITVTDAVMLKGDADVTLPGQAKARREVGVQEYGIPTASLVRNGSYVEPTTGDLYAVTSEGESLGTFKVMPASGRAAFDYSDNEGTSRVRVRTKKV